MNITQLSWYQKAIEHEISLITEDFVGNIEFKFNIKCNGITNMNINLAKSVKMPEPVYSNNSRHQSAIT